MQFTHTHHHCILVTCCWFSSPAVCYFARSSFPEGFDCISPDYYYVLSVRSSPCLRSITFYSVPLPGRTEFTSSLTLVAVHRLPFTFSYLFLRFAVPTTLHTPATFTRLSRLPTCLLPFHHHLFILPSLPTAVLFGQDIHTYIHLVGFTTNLRLYLVRSASTISSHHHFTCLSLPIPTIVILFYHGLDTYYYTILPTTTRFFVQFTTTLYGFIPFPTPLVTVGSAVHLHTHITLLLPSTPFQRTAALAGSPHRRFF